jgi:acyl carrier protein
MTDLKKQIREFIERNFMVDPSTELKDSDSLLDLQIIDSTGFLELIHYVEDAFGIRLADEEMVPDNLETIDNIAAFVTRKRGE